MSSPSPAPAVTVLIPVLNAARWLPTLLPALLDQQPRPPDEILIVDSGSTDGTPELAARHPRVRVLRVEKFSHGGARNFGAREAKGEWLVLMTQDATPRDRDWLARLVAPLADPQIAAVCSRQIPRDDASPMERYFLESHFPAEPAVRRARPGQTEFLLGDVFFSNVSAVVRRDLLLRFPFDEQIIMSEDQQFARDLLRAGYAVAYEPTSAVLHSHNYTLSVCFRRYFDSVYSLTQIFPAHDMGTSTGMGLRYIFRELAWMLRHHPLWIPYYLLYNGAKVGGTIAAHYAEKMPRSWARRCSLHRYYWDGGRGRMICFDLRCPVDSRPGREAFSVADALGAAGQPVGVVTEGGLAPTRFLARSPVLAQPPAGKRTMAWPLPADLAHPPFPVEERAYWKGEPKFEHVVAFASREGWKTLEYCRSTPGEFLGVDADHELSAFEQLRQATVAIFAAPSPQCLVTPAEAMAAGCAVLAADNWALPPGARAGEHAWVVAEQEIPAALQRLLEDAQRGQRRSLRDAGFALAAQWRPALVAASWLDYLCRLA